MLLDEIEYHERHALAEIMARAISDLTIITFQNLHDSSTHEHCLSSTIDQLVHSPRVDYTSIQDFDKASEFGTVDRIAYQEHLKFSKHMDELT